VKEYLPQEVDPVLNICTTTLERWWKKHTGDQYL